MTCHTAQQTERHHSIARATAYVLGQTTASATRPTTEISAKNKVTTALHNQIKIITFDINKNCTIFSSGDYRSNTTRHN